MAEWLKQNEGTVVALTTSALAIAATAVRALWAVLVERPAKKLEAKEAELKAEQQDHIRTLRTLVALQAKYDRLRGGDSTPPPSSL